MDWNFYSQFSISKTQIALFHLNLFLEKKKNLLFLKRIIQNLIFKIGKKKVILQNKQCLTNTHSLKTKFILID